MVGFAQREGEEACSSLRRDLVDGAAGIGSHKKVSRTVEGEAVGATHRGECAACTLRSEFVNVVAAVVALKEVSCAVECQAIRRAQSKSERALDSLRRLLYYVVAPISAYEQVLAG